MKVRFMTTITQDPYSLVGTRAREAVQKGLAEAAWYQTPVPRQELRKLLERRNGPALRDTALWFGLILGTGYATWLLWGSFWAVIPYLVYCVLFASSSDSRWHESSHGTAFKTDWMNNSLYELSSFMVKRESVPWRWSHVRHHSDTIIVGRDPEIHVPRPPNLCTIILKFFNIVGYRRYFVTMILHCFGRLTPEEATYIPSAEHRKVFVRARIYVLLYAMVVGLCFVTGSIFPLVMVVLPNLFGAWLMSLYGYTQHAGLAEDVLDHRLNCRTVYMNPVNRFLYWNMNYHLEHHMYPLVPYHALPRLHELVKEECPPAYRGLVDAYREIIPAVLRQIRDPGYFIKRRIPESAQKSGGQPTAEIIRSGETPRDGWVRVCSTDRLDREDVVRFDHGDHTFAVYRTEDDRYFATDGICTHGHAHLAEGMVKGTLIECPKHNGRFDIRDGSPQRPPVCTGLRTYSVRVDDGHIELDLTSAGGSGAALQETAHRFRVVESKNVATFIREMILEPESEGFSWTPGDYLQFQIPRYDTISFERLDVQEPYRAVWKKGQVMDYGSENVLPVRRNYSIASNPDRERCIRLNVRIATPPRGQDCDAGVGSTYMWSRKPGDVVTAVGPLGDFHVKDSEKEMVYIGGGAGMGPLRAHLSWLLETRRSKRTIRYWYGARSRQELFYEDWLRELERDHANFSYHPALSEPLPQDDWDGSTGYVHEVVRDEFLRHRKDLSGVEFYLCGPPPMIQATRDMLRQAGVGEGDIAFDEFT